MLLAEETENFIFSFFMSYETLKYLRVSHTVLSQEIHASFLMPDF
jgi:hypothetical protein